MGVLLIVSLFLLFFYISQSCRLPCLTFFRNVLVGLDAESKGKEVRDVVPRDGESGSEVGVLSILHRYMRVLLEDGSNASGLHMVAPRMFKVLGEANKNIFDLNSYLNEPKL